MAIAGDLGQAYCASVTRRPCTAYGPSQAYWGAAGRAGAPTGDMCAHVQRCAAPWSPGLSHTEQGPRGVGCGEEGAFISFWIVLPPENTGIAFGQEREGKGREGNEKKK